jgi:uncharacterized protein
MAGAAVRVTKEPTTRRFEIRSDEGVSFLRYAESDGVIRLIHTEVPENLQGRGYAGELAHAALEHARRANLRVVPICPFVRSYLERHPEYADLVEPAAGR